MEAVLTRLRGLSADELREEFARADLKCGPITATTRAIFERKLARALAKPEDSTETDSSSTPNDSGGAASSGTDQNSVPCATSASALTVNSTSSGASPPQAASEDVDFGYGMGLNPPEEEEISVKSRSTSNFSAEGSCPDTPSKHEQVSQTFFGVCPMWEDVFARNERAHVYTDKKEALQAVKMMKGARFKAFSNREDAEKFAKGICDYYPSPSKSMSCVSPVKLGLVCKDNMEVDTINRERANSFKSPRTQDLTAKLRKAVEKGDETAFSELVWSNPRYLIGSGDNPTIVQEGCRYNVMHVAAKENQAGIVQLLLDTLENPEFMRLMYPDDKDVMLQKRIHYIVDLYLNTPDKAGFETPLHFACKFGCPEVVNILCSHPDIDKNCKNKYDQKPCEVICDRRNKTQEVKQKICEYLEDRCYIPLLRATDNSAQPVIGGPWSPEPLDRSSRSYSPQNTRSPKDPVMAVKAFAGPLSPSKADEFRRAWKTPPRDRARQFHHILKSDPDRGAERVGRDLARELGHPWAEYWDFLQSFVDLASAEGLRKLEDYLNNKDFSQRGHEEAGENETINRFRTPSPGKPKKFCNSISVGAFLDEGDDITLEEMKNRQNAALSRTITSSARSKDGGGALLKGAMGGHEFHILPMGHHHHHHRGADLIEAAAEQDPLCCCQDDDDLDRLLSPPPAASSSLACKNGFCPSSTTPFSSSSTRDRTRNGDKVSPRSSTSSSSSASCLLSPISNLMAEFERMTLQDSLDAGPSPPPPVVRERRSSGGGNRHREARDSSPSHYSSAAELSSGLGRLSLAPTTAGPDNVFDAGGEEAVGGWRTEGGGSEGDDGDVSSLGSSEEYFDTEDGLDGLLGGQRTRGGAAAAASGRTLCARSKSWDHGGRDLSSSGSSGSSYKSLDNTEFLPRTPPRIRKGLFLDGDSPTKLDRDVLVAIEAIDIDPQKHPSIHKWKSTIKKYSTSEMQSWPSPAVVKPPLHSYIPGSPAGSSSLASPVSRFSPVRHAAAASPEFSPSRYSPAHASFYQSCVNSYVSRYVSRNPFN